MIPAVKVYCYFFSNVSWSEKYVIKEIKQCRTSDCRLLVLKSRDNTKVSFRWHQNESDLIKLSKGSVKLSGRENLFGRIVETINK